MTDAPISSYPNTGSMREKVARNKTERLLNEAMDHIAGTLEQPTDPRAWDHLLIYAPPGAVFNRLMKVFKYDGPDAASITLGEIARAVEGIKLP